MLEVGNGGMTTEEYRCHFSIWALAKVSFNPCFFFHFCTTFVIVKIVRNLSRGRSPCQRVNHVKSGVIYFSAFIFSYDTIHVSGTIHTWNRGLTSGIRA